jgi:LmbE family N-acetylglucosaminyl deacetylase
MFVELSTSQIRNDLEKVQTTYEAIPKAKFKQVFNQALMAEHFSRQINHFDPAVIFTLDHEIGGYGHPEHVMVSQLVVEMAKDGQINPQYIYQSVFTNHMENTIMARHSRRMKSWGFAGDGWEKAKQVYQVDGMPEPSVEIKIKSVAELKMNYLRSYKENERKKINYFIPAFEDYTAEEYFSIFDREFYRIITL